MRNDSFELFVLTLANSGLVSSEAEAQVLWSDIRYGHPTTDLEFGRSKHDCASKIVRRLIQLNATHSAEGLIALLRERYTPGHTDVETLACVLADSGLAGFEPGDSPLARLHIQYLKSLFAQRWAFVPLADFSKEGRQLSLLDIYVSLPVDAHLELAIVDGQIRDWSLQGAAQSLSAGRVAGDRHVNPARMRIWPDLNIRDEAALQPIVDWINRDRMKRLGDARKQALMDEETWYLEAQDAASVQPRMVLVGETGAGKSSFLQHLALCLAGEVLGGMGETVPHRDAHLESVPGWLHGAMTPVYVEFWRIVRHFPKLPNGKPGAMDLPTVDVFWMALQDTVLTGELTAYTSQLQTLLEQGKVLLLIDGLDEVPDATDARRIRQIKAFFDRLSDAFPKARIVITSRPFAYKSGGLELKNFGRAELSRLSNERMDQLLGKLIALHEEDVSEAAMKDFKTALNAVPDALQRNPLLFTILVMCWLESPNAVGDLPLQRNELYRRAIDLMLVRWALKRSDARRGGTVQPEVDESRRVQAEAGMSPDNLLRMLQVLACNVHDLPLHRDAELSLEATESATVFHRKEILDVLADMSSSIKHERVLDYLEQLAGLLVSEAPKRFRFIHRSFQEFLAACALVKRLEEQTASQRPPLLDADAFPHGLLKRVYSAPDQWRHVVTLAAGELAANRRADLQLLLHDMAAWCADAGEQASSEQCAVALIALDLANAHGELDQPAAGEFDPRLPMLRALRACRDIVERWLLHASGSDDSRVES